MGKGEIARYDQFPLFPWCFQKTCTADTLKPGLVWERVNLDKCKILLLEKELNCHMKDLQFGQDLVYISIIKILNKI